MQRCYNNVRVVDGPSPDNVLRLDMAAIPMVMRMQANGIMVDKQHFAGLSQYLQSEKDRLTEKVYASTGYYINIGSPDQIEALLFKKVGLKPPPHFKLTESGKRYVVDDEALSSIKHLHPCISDIQDFTECHKLKSSYADVLPVIADADDRVHTHLGVTRQVSGRISSTKPNLMAQPTRSDLGKKIRKGFIANRRNGKRKKLGTIDQSQIEMRFAAHRSGCANMTDTFLRDGDIHVETATRIFFSWLPTKLGRMPSRKEAKAAGMDDMRHRYPAKRIGFGVLFGITGEGLQVQILVADDPTWSDDEREAFRAEWPIERCDKTIIEWFNVYPEIRDYMQSETAKARRYGYIWDMWGRIRWMPQLKSVHKRIIQEGVRAIGSFGIQSSAQGSMKLFMAQCFDELIERKYKGVVEPLMQIHDECLFEGDESAMDDFLGDAGQIMEQVVTLDVPIRYGTGSADNWGDIDK